jgi:hypothetical protein
MGGAEEEEKEGGKACPGAGAATQCKGGLTLVAPSDARMQGGLPRLPRPPKPPKPGVITSGVLPKVGDVLEVEVCDEGLTLTLTPALTMNLSLPYPYPYPTLTLPNPPNPTVTLTLALAL